MFLFGPRPSMLIHHEDGSYSAFDAVCTHLGCTVRFEPENRRIHCPCHGGVYDINTGAVVSGPPPRALKAYRAEAADGNGHPGPKSQGLYEWLDDRLSLSEIGAFARHKMVPQHKQSFWYYWGGISLFLFILQLFTGILLLVCFRPGKEAFESVRQITYDVEFGWLVRSAHSWSANLMVFAVFVHMFSVFFMKAYRKPREFGWWSGLALLGLVMVFGFSGYLLPVDELSYFATKWASRSPI